VTVPVSSPWSSPEACTAAVTAGRRAHRTPGTVRLGTWNVRWFPDGGPGQPSHRSRGPLPTNVEWLACSIAWLDVDVLAFEEMKSTPEASAALAILMARLDALTLGTWRAEIDRCPGGGRQSVAILYDAKRVKADSFRNVAALNPHGGACDEHLRPGFGGYFHFPGGADLHFVAVHLKSGEGGREYGLRRASIRGAVAAYRDLQTTALDDDVVLAGDFNTMGCLECKPKIRAPAEIAEVTAALAGLEVPFRRVESWPACSEYYRGEGGLLDHFVVTRGMREVPLEARAHVEGYCAEVSCARLDERHMPRAYGELSDHCPTVLEVSDRDLD
jgi:endonuclease/exonuclease/phosphatase family metal-dependent hydrolase